MGEKKCFKIMLIFVGLFSVAALSPIAIGDGCIFIPTIYDWVYANEEKQIGVIDYENGIENLTLMIDVKDSTLSTDEAFWIFPVPGDPNDIDIGITKHVDFYEGGYRDIRDNVKSSITDKLMVATFSQAYLSIIPFIYMYVSGGMLSGGINDVEVYEEAQKMGVTSQLLSANSSEGLNKYLSLKNITLPEAANNIIDGYIGNDYSFVVSWISNVTEFKNQAAQSYSEYYWGYYGEPYYIIGLSVEFLTEDIFYPMKLTSIYGDKQIPILIQINGYVTPKNSYNGMGTSYYSGEGGYTEITINTQSSEFTEDFVIENKVPNDVQNAIFIKNNSLLFSLAIFVVCSILSSLTAAFIIYNKNKPDYKKFALMGFGNFLTIFFVFFISLKLKINEKFVEISIPEKNVSELFDKGFKITFGVLGIVCLILFLLSYTLSSTFMYAALFFPVIISFVVGILILIYGSLKNPRVLCYTVLYSVFFYIFLIISSITLNMLL